MREVQGLFGTELVKSPIDKLPVERLRSALSKDLNESIYKFQIRYNRVFYGKVKKFPAGISKEQWLFEAESLWHRKEVKLKHYPFNTVSLQSQLKLLNVTKANQ